MPTPTESKSHDSLKAGEHDVLFVPLVIHLGILVESIGRIDMMHPPEIKHGNGRYLIYSFILDLPLMT